MGFWGWTMMVAFWLVIVALMFWLVRSASTSGRGSTEPSALEILERRLAHGEIDTNEFAEKKKLLESRR